MDVSLLNLDNRWAFIMMNVVAWVVISSVLELLLFDRGILRAVIPAVVGGFTSGIVLLDRRQHAGK